MNEPKPPRWVPTNQEMEAIKNLVKADAPELPPPVIGSMDSLGRPML